MRGDILIDWISATIGEFSGDASLDLQAWRIADYLGEMTRGAIAFADLKVSPGRFPYSHKFSNRDNSITVFFTASGGPALIEISGKGCAALTATGGIANVVNELVDTITRFDIAVDMETDTHPEEFADKRSNKRHKSNSSHESESGYTRYVGSKSSERYARVYRYYEPHPRANLLRCEMVFRKDAAQDTAAYWLTHGYDAAAGAAGAVYGWEHEAWQINEMEKIPTRPVDRSNANTIYWLRTSVAPAVQRLISEGSITPEEAIEWLVGPQGQEREPAGRV